MKARKMHRPEPKTRRTDRRTVAAARPLAACPQTQYGQTELGTSHGYQRHLVDTEDGTTLARFARAIWEVANGCQSLLSLAAKRGMRTYLCPIAADKRPRWTDQLGGALRGWEHHSCPPTCCWGKKSTPEALGRSQGGFSTKLHVRAEGGGKLMTFVLTAGERHELSVAETLVEQGAVKRDARNGLWGTKVTAVASSGAFCASTVSAIPSRVRSMSIEGVALTDKSIASVTGSSDYSIV